ncbi:MAG: DUF4350 domain-containing protein [Armatimonadota bacterium]
MATIVYDAFFHQLPGHRLGEHLVTGGYGESTGRYAPDDCFHPNGLSVLQADLAPEHEIRLLHAPYSDLSLYNADILLVPNPDYPLYAGTATYRWTPADVDALWRFMERGGGVLLLINSFLSRPDYWEENFDLERVSLLFDRLGVRWDANFMSDDQRIEPARVGDRPFGYGQGGRVAGMLPQGVEPLITFEGNTYGFTARIGAGRLAVVGDAGSISNGLYCYPGFENAAVCRELLNRLLPAWVGRTSRWDYRTFRSLSAAPSKTGVTEEALRALNPAADWLVDHHFRHLTWNGPEVQGAGDEIWEQTPFVLTTICDQASAARPFRWLSLDGSDRGPAYEMPLAVQCTRGRDGAELFVTGRAQSGSVTWDDLCDRPELPAPAGRLEQIHAVFLLRATLDTEGRPLRARWSLGQNLYARHPDAAKYGRLLESESGVIVPRA